MFLKKNQDNWQFSGLTIEECKIAINNEWDNENNNLILNYYIKHRNFKKINVLKIKKSELNKSLDILDKINEKNRNTFKSLSEDFEINNINNLDNKFLSCSTKKEDLLKKVTPEFLNKFLDNFLQKKGDENLVEKNLNGWLKGEDPLLNQDKLRGYISGAKVIEKKSELDKSLADSFAKINDTTIKLKKDEELKLKIVDVNGPGILSILTGSELAADAENHHNTWLQYSNAHFPNTSYQVVQPLIIRMEYNTLLMSATFPKKNFSISTSKPRKVYSITKFFNQTEWENEKIQIFFRTTANEYSRKINGEEDTDAKPILKSELTSKKFKLLEESDISFVIFDNTNSSAISGITEGMPSEPEAERWIYNEKDVQYLSVTSMVQQIGHVGHLKKEKAFLTTQQLKELIPSDNIVFHLISGTMLLLSEELMKKLNTLKAVIIGVKGNPKLSFANQICPIYDNLQDPDVKDPNLWVLHTE
ncbi:21764_t:CDS:2, partial [Cetraspora pellucida]